MSDSSWLNQCSTPCITYGLRGIIYFYVEVMGIYSVLHSGYHGGAVCEPMHDLIALLASLVDTSGFPVVPGIFEDVQCDDEEELK
ncbi:unnamed protein product [Protopolystoma xenopodis]|uniref:Uncharacterized protein n=1 Tax=Protopolystoma xenopodis TaxID=117903 RepID=A0A3S5A7Z1_9PLAT|nr:unnamed protein product [Protopolystoma xenopodis]